MSDATRESAPTAAVPLVYIIDEPATEDRFGSHTAIVNAIVSTIDTQKHTRLIGLLGRWGTGKSTIVTRLAATLETAYKDKYVLFTYDAWAHQGDPARRSILEELIARLIGLKLTRLAKWEQTLSDISGSTERSSTVTKTHLSGWGKLLVGLLLLIPVFALSIDAETVRKAFADYPDSLSLNLIRAFLIYVVLLTIVAITATVLSMDYRALADRAKPLASRIWAFLRSGEDLLSIMLTRQFSGSSSTTLRRSQPTAIEFRRYLRKIIESQRPRRLVFVIDNLDRISPSDALDIWSIMVGMVADESHRLNAAIEPIVIFPFDPIALGAIIPDGKLRGHSAADLIEKSFDVTFEVPPPVLSNWRGYFAAQYEKCGLSGSTDHSTFEQYWTLRNFESYLGRARVTPRKINRFLNRVISLNEQQAERFGPAVLSYYVAHEDAIQADCLAFVKNKRPGFDQTKAWQLKIAAISFGTTQDQAAQVLLGDELSDSLAERDFDRFKDLVEVAGFKDVVTNLIESPPEDETGLTDPGPLTALASFLGRLPHPVQDAVLWSRLWGAWKNANFGTADGLTASAINAFIGAMSDEVKRDAPFVCARIVNQISVGRDPDQIKELTAVGDTIVDSAGEDFGVNVDGDADLLLKIIGSTGKESRFAESLRCGCSFEDLADAVVRRLNGKAPILAPDTFEVVTNRITTEQVSGEKEAFFAAVGEGLREIVSNVESPDQSLVASCLILASRDATGSMRYLPLIGELDGAGTLDAEIRKATENGADVVVSTLTALMLTAGSMPTQDTLNVLEPWLKIDENARHLLASISQINGGAFLTVLRDLEAGGNDIGPILKPVLRQAMARNNLGRRVHTSWLLKSFRQSVEWLSSNEAATFANLLMNCGGFSEAVQKLSDSDFLFFISKLPPKEARALLAERMNAFDAARLAKSIFAADGTWLAYSRLGVELGRELGPKTKPFQALQLVLGGTLGTLGPRVVQRAMKVAQSLSSHARKQLVRSIVASTVETRDSSTILALANVEGFDSYIARPAVAAKILAELFQPLRRTRDGQRFIERHAAAFAQVPEAARSEMEGSLRRALKSQDARTADWAKYVLSKSGS